MIDLKFYNFEVSITDGRQEPIKVKFKLEFVEKVVTVQITPEIKEKELVKVKPL
jgi:hypothetical protein